MTFENAVLVDEDSGAHFLPVTDVDWVETDILTSRAMRDLLGRLRSSYDVVILEMAPVLPVAETRAIAAMADGTLLVVKWRTTPVDVMHKAIRQLDRIGAKMIGSLLCRINLKSSIASSVGEDVYYYPTARPKAA